mgnify:CR=1 FL=1
MKGSVLMIRQSTLAIFFFVLACGQQTGSEGPPSKPPPESANSHADDGAFNPEAGGSEPDNVIDNRPMDSAGGGLNSRRLLARISLDLRGRRPTELELRHLDSQPDALNTFIEQALDDAGFVDRVADHMARIMRSRYESYPIAPADGGFDEESIQRAAGREATELVRHIVSEKRPYSEVLTADYTFANEVLAAEFPISDYDSSVGGWQQVRYSDQRPPAGLLVSNTFYLRYLTDGINHNRGRANAVSRIFLCDDYLKRPIDFPRNINLNDETGVQNAVRENPACQSCHATLDPLASFFGPFTLIEDEGRRYDPDALDAWEETTEVPPSYFGQDGETMADLAGAMVADPRFALCIVRRTYEDLLDRPATAADRIALQGHTQRFIEGGMTFHALYRSLVNDPVYRGQNDGERLALAGKLMRPATLGDAIFALTRFRWQLDGWDAMRNENMGYRVLGGGVSSLSGEFPSRLANVTRVLVQERIAELAAAYVGYFDDDAHRILFGDDGIHGERDFTELLNRLTTSIWGRHSTPAEADDYRALYASLIADEMAVDSAWVAIVSLLLRDPQFLIY